MVGGGGAFRFGPQVKAWRFDAIGLGQTRSSAVLEDPPFLKWKPFWSWRTGLRILFGRDRDAAGVCRRHFPLPPRA